jgi:hypothetical protein
MRGTCVPAMCLEAVFIAACFRPSNQDPDSWDQKAAAYLDQRAGWRNGDHSIMSKSSEHQGTEVAKLTLKARVGGKV